jgi:glycosyltransferase involved in cell wall biosynthesis
MAQPSLELSMIVKNGAATLARCLASARGLVDEIVIGDTGSTDDTVEIARSFGARVFDMGWEDDFSRARNAVLEKSRCDWVLVLDADEMLDGEAMEAVPPLLACPEVCSYEVWKWHYVRSLNSRSGDRAAEVNPVRLKEAEEYPAYTSSLSTLLFRRHAGIRFERRVHESVAESMRRLGRKTAAAPFVVHHFGFVEGGEESRREKNEFYQRLGEAKVRENPRDAEAHFELGLGELEHHRNAAAALPYFEQAVRLNPRLIAGWIFCGVCLTRLGRAAEAITRLTRAEALGATTVVFHEAMGDAFLHTSNCEQARYHYQQAWMRGGASALLQCKLGAAEVRAGHTAAGLERMQRAVARDPEFSELYDVLAAGALLAGDVALAARTAEARLAIGKLSAGEFLLAAELQKLSGDGVRAMEILRCGMERFPDEAQLRAAWAVLQR